VGEAFWIFDTTPHTLCWRWRRAYPRKYARNDLDAMGNYQTRHANKLGKKENNDGYHRRKSAGDVEPHRE